MITPLPRAGSPMTIIAGMRESPDSILIAADSGLLVVDSMVVPGRPNARMRHEHKLQRSDLDVILAWGVSGDESTARVIDRWLRTHVPKSWQALEKKLEKKLGMLNKTARERLQASGCFGQEQFAMSGSSVLLVGCIGGSLKGLIVDNCAQSSDFFDSFHFIGKAKTELYIVFRALEALGPITWEVFHAGLDAAARTMEGCDPPIHMWRVTSDRIEPLK